MVRAVWNEIYSVQITLIDDQHKALVDFINQAYEHLESSTDDPFFFQDFFQRLSNHAQTHFGTEEKYFSEFQYPDAPPHIAEHDRIKTNIVELQTKYKNSLNPDIIIDTLQFLDDWLFDHIMNFDKKYSALFKAHGLK